MTVNPRQQAALAFLNQPQNTRITNSVLQGLFPDVHAETIRRDLADLVTRDILSKKGQKRGSYYVLNPGQSQED
jgi:ATP-dependent DNA helicase RecG